ncbi:MAG: hypothetical protein IJJ20_03580 [Thermoguttaceae bacterium]|nr:hypothetical protein [Thermoguttaceae bacterium]
MALLEGSLKVTGFVEAAEFRGLREESVLTGDGAARRFRVRHGLGSRFVRLALYDGAGRRVYAPYRAAGESEVTVSFCVPPAPGETFTAVIRL